MAKTQGPLFSVSAAGTVAGTVTHRRTRAGQVAQRPAIPSDAPSPQQLAERQRMRDAAASWMALDPTTVGKWIALATARGHAPWVEYWREWQAQRAAAGNTLLIPAI